MRIPLAAFITFIGCGSLLAFEPVPARSYTKPTADGRHLLVMLVPRSIRDVPNDELRTKYGQSGFYPVDALKRPLWTCDWYVQFESGVMPTNDGEFVVRVPDRKRNWRQIVDGKYRVPPRPPGIEKLAAAIVYRNGQLHRTVALDELFDCSKFTNADCDGGPECALDRFSDSTNRVTIRTTANGVVMKRTIDFRTGEVFAVGAGDISDEAASNSFKVRPPTDPDGVTDRPRLSTERSRLVRVILAGVVVVIATTLAFLTLAFVLIRGQSPGAANPRSPKLST